jgi:predicted nucleic acid-binding protein
LIGIDSNLLIYAHRIDMKEHDAAREAILDLIESNRAWAIPWPCISEFLAVVTRANYFKRPTPMAIAMAQITLWVAAKNCAVLSFSMGHLTTLTRVLTQTGWVGQKVHDASIASICIDNRVSELWSTDDSFTGVQGLRVANPLRVR